MDSMNKYNDERTHTYDIYDDIMFTLTFQQLIYKGTQRYLYDDDGDPSIISHLFTLNIHILSTENILMRKIYRH